MRIPTGVSGIVLLGVTLVAGVMLGAALEHHRSSGSLTMSMPADAHVVMQQLHHHLQLDSGQHDRIAAILTHHQRSVDSAWQMIHPHMRATMDSTLLEVEAELRPDQLAKYHALVAAMHPDAGKHEQRPHDH